MLFKQVHDSQSNLDVQITKEGITGVFNGVLSDFGDRMSSDGISTLGTISFQQFKPTDLKASNPSLTFTANWTCIAPSWREKFCMLSQRCCSRSHW